MRRPFIVLFTVAGLGGSAYAQSAPNALPGPSNCAPGTSPTVGNDNPGNNLSAKLAQSNGVICPPGGVDPQMATPPPQAGGTMPVIPPPGSPGGNQNVQPK